MGLTRAARAPGACDEPLSGPSPHESDPLFFDLFFIFYFRPNLHADDDRADLDISPTLQISAQAPVQMVSEWSLQSRHNGATPWAHRRPHCNIYDPFSSEVHLR